MIHLHIQNMYPRSVSGQCPQPKALLEIWIRGWWVMFVMTLIFITGTSCGVTRFCLEIIRCEVHAECDGGHHSTAQNPHVLSSAAERFLHFALHTHWLVNWVLSLHKISNHSCITTYVLATGSCILVWCSQN